jgi:L-aminopeptidase/D-esterase-like protein
MEIIEDSLVVGHYTSEENKTGLTVFIPKKRAACGYYLCGSAPALREVSVLDVSMSNKIDALVFSGGSCFGLGSANGVMKWLAEKKRGIRIGKQIIPIVPTACIFDRGIYEFGIYPKEEHAYLACKNANAAFPPTGRVGAGTGATVGKLINNTSCYEGGFGYSIAEGLNGLWVITYAVVNSVGNIIDNSSNNILAGATSIQGKFIEHKEMLDNIKSPYNASGANTTLVAVFTNALLSDKELKSVAKMASSGMAQAIAPCFTPYDGDIVFTVSLGKLKADIMTVGMLAAESTRKAIINAVEGSKVLLNC